MTIPKNQILSTLNTWNFWDKKPQKLGVARDKYLTKLLSFTKLEEIIAVSGIRRSGKSTLLLQLMQALNKDGVSYQNMLYVNFEDPRLSNRTGVVDLFEILEVYRQHFGPKRKIYLFFDEIQLVENWEKFVRTIYDQKQNLKIFITGSNSRDIEKSSSTALSGRIISLRIFPLDFAEFLKFKKHSQQQENLQPLFAEYLKYGGFPKVVLEENISFKKHLLLSYYESILEKDVIIRNKIKNTLALKKLARFVISNVSHQISSYALEKSLGISHVSINQYLGFLNDAYLIELVPRFSYSVKKQIYNPDKVFCADNGLINLAGFSFSENKGQLLENVVFNYLKKQNKQIYYWKNGTEVDFLTQKGHQVDELLNVTLTADDPQVLKRELNSLSLGNKEFPTTNTKLLSLYNQSQQKTAINLLDYLLEKQRCIVCT